MALLLGIYLVGIGGWPILVIGLMSLACAIGYTGGPFPLAYHGLGDLFVFVFFGLVAVGGTYWVQALEFGPQALLAGGGMGALATAILVLNNLRDIDTDARAGKRTLAVRIGRTGTKIEFLLLLLFGFGVPAIGVAFFGWSGWVLMSLHAILLLLRPCWAVLAATPATDPSTLIPHLGRTAQAAGLYGLLLGLGLALT